MHRKEHYNSMLKAMALTGAALIAAAVSASPATASRLEPHLYYRHTDGSLTLCGTHDHTPVGPADDSYQVRNTYWRGTGPTCIKTHADGSTSFTVTRTPGPTRTDGGWGAVTTYPAVFRGCIWDMCTRNTPLPARADQLRSVTGSWSTVSTRPVTTTVRNSSLAVSVTRSSIRPSSRKSRSPGCAECTSAA